MLHTIWIGMILVLINYFYGRIIKILQKKKIKYGNNQNRIQKLKTVIKNGKLW